MQFPLSVLILAHNEESNIQDCIRSCLFAQEIIVMDDFSTDGTVAIAESMGARVVLRALSGDWASQQNAAIAEAKCDWVMFIDADERVTPELAAAIQDVVSVGKKACYWMRRVNRFSYCHSTHGVNRPYWLPRLFPKEGAQVVGQVHPRIDTPFQKVRIRGDLLHYPYRTWNSYFSKLEKYAELSAMKYVQEGRYCDFWWNVVLRPIWAFFKIYVLDRGFLDGRSGFIFSIGHAYYTMSKYARYYQMKQSDGKL